MSYSDGKDTASLIDDSKNVPSTRRLQLYNEYFRIALAALALMILGSWIIVPFFISQNLACSLSEQYWFRALWYPNHQYADVLSKNSWTKIDGCRLIVATSWMSCLGIILFFGRVILEFKYFSIKDTTTYGYDIGGPFLLFVAIGVLGMLPFSPTEIPDHKIKSSLIMSFKRIDIFDEKYISHYTLTFFQYLDICFYAKNFQVCFVRFVNTLSNGVDLE